MANGRRVDKPKFPGPDLTGKKLVQVNPRTRIYVDVNISDDDLAKLKEKYNGVMSNVTGHEFGKERKGLN